MPTPGPLELVIILVVALLILGPGKLPEVGAALGKSIREFRKASSDLTDATKIDTSPLPPPAPAPQTTTVSPSAAPAPTPEPSSVTPTASTVPAPIAMPQAPGDDDTDRTT
jgi:sec-independent protein translocase protein TatA